MRTPIATMPVAQPPPRPSHTRVNPAADRSGRSRLAVTEVRRETQVGQDEDSESPSRTRNCLLHQSVDSERHRRLRGAHEDVVGLDLAIDDVPRMETNECLEE